MTQKLRDERRLQAERVAQIELIRRQMEEEKERRRAIIAEVSLLRCHKCVAVRIRIQMLSESHSFFCKSETLSETSLTRTWSETRF